MSAETNAKLRTPSPTPAAVRMRRYRKGRRMELRWLRIALHVTDINAFIRLGLLKEDERQDEEALRAAVMSLVYRAGEGLAWRNGGDPRGA